jgi:hypothetical protein
LDAANPSARFLDREAAPQGVVAAGIGMLDYASVSDRIAGASSDVAQAAVGVGLYAVIAGGIAVIVGGFIKR